MACAWRYVDGLRHTAAARARHRFYPPVATEYLRLWTGGAPASAGRRQPVRIVREFAAHQLQTRPGELRIPQALYRRVEHRRRALQPRLLDHATSRFLPLAGAEGGRSRLARHERTAMV